MIGFDVVDNAAGLIAEMGGADVAGHLTEANSITVDDTQTGSVVNANDGAILAGFTADVGFDVVDDADAIALEVAGASNSGDELNSVDADGVINTVVVSGGDVDTADAGVIQSISGYDASGSNYEITDDVDAVIGAGNSVIENVGVTRVKVTDDADATEGVSLNAYNANVDFNVEDTASNIATNAMNLTKADDVDAVSGTVTVAQAEDVQDLTGYDASGSNYEITDDVDAVIGAGNSVIENVGVTKVNVTDVAECNSRVYLLMLIMRM